MRAVDFPSETSTDLSTYGLDNPRLRVALYLGKENAEKHVLLGKQTEKNELYVQVSGLPTVYTVSDWVYRDLNKAVGDFRDKTLLAFDRDKITAVAVKHKDGGELKLVRGNNKEWRVDGNEGKPMEPTISQFLGDLHDLKGYEVLADHPSDLSQFGLDQPLVTLTVFGENNQKIGAVLLAPRPGDEGKKEYIGMAEGGPTVFLVRDYLITRLNKQAQDFIQQPTPTVGSGTPAAAVNTESGADEEPADDEPLGDTGQEQD
jgi:hypothetical protein